MSYLLARHEGKGLEKHFVAAYVQKKAKAGELKRRVAAPTWKQSDNSSKRYIRRDFANRDKTEKRDALKVGKDASKDYTERSFHGVTGNLYV